MSINISNLDFKHALVSCLSLYNIEFKISMKLCTPKVTLLKDHKIKK